MMDDREVSWLNLELLPEQPHEKAGNEEGKRKKKQNVNSEFTVFTLLQKLFGDSILYWMRSNHGLKPLLNVNNHNCL